MAHSEGGCCGCLLCFIIYLVTLCMRGIHLILLSVPLEMFIYWYLYLLKIYSFSSREMLLWSLIFISAIFINVLLLLLKRTRAWIQCFNWKLYCFSFLWINSFFSCLEERMGYFLLLAMSQLQFLLFLKSVFGSVRYGFRCIHLTDIIQRWKGKKQKKARGELNFLCIFLWFF